MKVARTYTIDHEIVERMQNINASDLINRLLKEHFEAYSPNNTVLDEKKALIKQISDKKKRLTKKLGLLKNGMTSTLTTMQKHGLKLVKKSQAKLKSLSTLRIGIYHTQPKTLSEAGNCKINSESLSNEV